MAQPTLGASASRGAAVTMTGQIIRITLQLASVAILARLLSPHDYGLLAMVLAIIGVGEVFRDFGLSSAAIQAPTLSRGQRGNLLWINTSVGAALTMTVILASGAIASFYDEPRLQPLSQVLSVTFFFNGMATQYRASLSRSMKFAKLSIAEIIGQAAGLIIGVGLALGGSGYWALAFQQVTQTLVTLVMVAIFAGWMPRQFDRREPVGHFLKFGGNLLAAQFLTYASKNVNSVVIGNQFGASPLGLYNRAFQLLTLPLNQINAPSTRVALPTLSKLHADPIRYRAFILTGQTVLLHLIAAIFAFSAAQAGALIPIALGPQWIDAVPLFQILAFAGVFQAASYPTNWIFLSKGLTGAQLRFALATRPIAIVVIICGAFWGIEGAAWAYTLTTALSWPLGFIWVRHSGAPVWELFGNGVRAVLGYGFAGAASFFSTRFLHELNDWVQLLIGATVFFVALAFVTVVWPQFKADLKRILRSGRLLVRRS